jgi:putative addiction module antidote
MALVRRSRLRYNTRMNTTLKITRIGNSAGIILPKEVLARLRVWPGDTLHLTESPDGVRLTAHDADFEADMAIAEEIMREDRRILRALAK